MATKHAVALRAFDHAGDSYAPGPAFPLGAGYLTEWSAPGVGLVREATSAEIAKLHGDKPSRRSTTTRQTRKSKAPTPAIAPAPAPAADIIDPVPAAPAA